MGGIIGLIRMTLSVAANRCRITDLQKSIGNISIFRAVYVCRYKLITSMQKSRRKNPGISHA
jgi:hypothetical protein